MVFKSFRFIAEKLFLLIDLHPLVTIDIPNYNFAKYIEDTLNSLINQSYQNIELIIIDDCSMKAGFGNF